MTGAGAELEREVVGAAHLCSPVYNTKVYKVEYSLYISIDVRNLFEDNI